MVLWSPTHTYEKGADIAPASVSLVLPKHCWSCEKFVVLNLELLLLRSSAHRHSPETNQDSKSVQRVLKVLLSSLNCDLNQWAVHIYLQIKNWRNTRGAQQTECSNSETIVLKSELRICHGLQYSIVVLILTMQQNGFKYRFLATS